MPSAVRERFRDATAAAFRRIVTTAIDKEVAALIVAGDLFDGTENNLRAQVSVRRELARLEEAGIRAFVVAGNHDPLGSLAPSVRLPESVHVFGPGVEPVSLEWRGREVAWIYGVSYEKSATYRNLAADFPRDPGGPFNIAVLHANVGDRPGHGRYAPCKLADLLGARFDYWALGHVHTRDTLHDRDPVVHYPGNPQGLHKGEPGARGATLVRVSDGGGVELRPVWTDVVRWHRARTAIDDMETVDDLVGAYSELAGALRGKAPDRTHVVRWTLTGHGPLHAELSGPGQVGELRDALRSAEGVRAVGSPVWLERIELATRPVREIERLRERQDYLGDMLRLAAELEEAPPLPPRSEPGEARPIRDETPVAVAVRETLEELLESPRVGRALGEDPWRLLRWRELVARVEAIAVERLAPEEGASS